MGMDSTHTPITGPQNARYEGAWMAKTVIHTAPNTVAGQKIDYLFVIPEMSNSIYLGHIL